MARPARPRVELPEVTALAAVGIPKSPVSDLVQAANPFPSIVSMMEPIKVSPELVDREVTPSALTRIDPDLAGTAPTDQTRKRIPANLAIYSAASLMLGVSAPGMTSVIRRGTAKAKRRLTVAPGGRAFGPPG